MLEFLKSIKEILEFPIVHYKSFTLTAFSLLVIILILSIARLVIWLLSKVIKQRLQKSPQQAGSALAIIQLIKYAIYTIAILIALNSTGIDITILLAGSAALFVGLGFGLQHTFNDIISGLILLFEGSIQVGDVVEIQSVVGRVRKIGLRTSTIHSRDGITIIVPNSKFVSDSVVNWSHENFAARFHIHVGVAYGSDVELVKEILLSCAKSHKEVLSTPPPDVRLTDFADSSIQFDLLFWTNNGFYVENIKSQIRFAIYREFNAKGVQIPFPQMDLHMISDLTRKGTPPESNPGSH